MFHPSNQAPDGSIKQADVQDLLENAQLAAGRLYGDVPYLCEALQAALREGVQKCEIAEVGALEILKQQMRTERRVLDAYNKHRLGRAAHVYYKNARVPNNAVEYDEADNVPNTFKFFPLMGEIKLRGFQVAAPHIYQVPGTIDHNQEFSARLVGATASTQTWITPPPTPSPNYVQPGGKNKSGRGQTKYDKLSDAPSAWLALPDGNLTLAEILCFVPQAIKSWDVIDRMLHNGAFTVTIAGMINHFRNMPQGQIGNNSVYRMMKGPMDRRAKDEPEYEGWSVSKHQSIKKPHGFDPASVSVKGFRAPVNYHRREPAAAAHSNLGTILFRDLLNGVKVMPTGCDALDLTRCVRYCVDNPEDDWYYPQDFVKLVSKLPHDPRRPHGSKGPAPVLPDHRDKAAVDRHTSVHKQREATRAFHRRRDNAGRLAPEFSPNEEDAMETRIDDVTPSKKRKNWEHRTIGSDSEEGGSTSMIRNAKRKKLLSLGTPTCTRNSSRYKGPSLRLRSDITMEDIDLDKVEDNYQGPRQQGKRTSTQLRSSGRTKRVVGSYNIDATLGDENDFETPTKPRAVPFAALRLMGKITEEDQGGDEEMEYVSDFEE